MKSTTLALASLLASAAVAQPHRQNRHQHPAKHVKKDVVWVTDWVSVTETVGITTTIWVDEGFVPSTSAAASQPSSSPKAASVAPSSSASPVPAQFFEPASKQSSPSVYVAPSPSPPPYVAPVQSVQPVSVPEIKSSAPPAPVYVAPTTTAPVYTAPAYTAPTSAAAPASSAPAGTGSGSTGGACSSGSPCTGDFTYYDAGLGACGITNDGTTDKVVALSKLMMGAQSNSGDGANANPFCGKTITVKYKGKTTTAKVVDKCGDCSHDSIDLSKAAYADLADEGLGRDKAEWYFN